jgi:hypothetical protein
MNLPVKKPLDSNLEALEQQAIQERKAFLKKNPHLSDFQKKIDRLLANAGNSEKRMTVLSMMMEANLQELKNQLKILSAKSDTLKKLTPLNP